MKIQNVPMGMLTLSVEGGVSVKDLDESGYTSKTIFIKLYSPSTPFNTWL